MAATAAMTRAHILRTENTWGVPFKLATTSRVMAGGVTMHSTIVSPIVVQLVSATAAEACNDPLMAASWIDTQAQSSRRLSLSRTSITAATPSLHPEGTSTSPAVMGPTTRSGTRPANMWQPRIEST